MSPPRVSVLLLEDGDGNLTGQVVGEPEATAVGPRRKSVLEQLKRFLEARMAEDPWYRPTALEDPVLAQFEVAVRPEYQVDGRVHPCAETVRFRVACVVGEHPSGLRLAALPRFGIHFYHHDQDPLPDLVQAYVGEALRGSTPAALASVLPPVEATLEELVVPRPRARRRPLEPPPPTLARVAEPLGDRGLRRRLSPPYERAGEVRDLLARVEEERASVLLVGESGAGKTAVLAEVARQAGRTGAGDGSGQRRERFWLTSGNRLVAGMRYLGQWEERCEAMLAELQETDGVLCLENLRELVTTGGRTPASGIGAFLIPYLRAGEVRLVGEVTPAELEACRRDLPELVDLLQLLPVRDMDRARALGALEAVVDARTTGGRLAVAPGVAPTLYRLFRRFLPYEVFPGRAAEMLRDLLERARAQRRERVEVEDALTRFRERTGLPEVFLRDDVPLSREDVEEGLRARVIGQARAVEAVAGRVTAFKAGMNPPGKPLGVFLLCGPTGVGKTQLARTLARFCFGEGGGEGEREGEKRLLRLDMSEYSTPGAAARLTLAPDGGPSEAVASIRRQPFQVVLLDEIEKADPEVFDVLLTILDEGRLVDGDGRVASFRSSFVLMTSNLGAGSDASIGFARHGRPNYAKHVRDFFRPEFVNRIDEVVLFDPLDPESLRVVARLELEALARREGLAARQLRLEWDEAVLDRVVEEGFHPLYGARPLQRAVERLVAVPLARRLAGHPGMRAGVLRLEVGGGGLRLR